MGAVYDEFERELLKLQRACQGDPRREVIRLFMMALEREELATVGYREALMESRLAGMPIPPDVREIIRHVLIWIWKDEGMHTIYIRGAILKLGSLRLRLQAFLTQAAGGLGGWASSVMVHSRWNRAPLSRLLASVVTAAGSIVGKVPADVRKHLQFGPFRNFCTFNIDAEKTAAVCWYRIANLAANQSDLDVKLSRDFRQVAIDEDRHCALFTILEKVLTDQDTLAPGVTAAELVERIRTVGEEFLPRSYRSRSDLDNPLGSGQPVYVLQSNDRSKKRKLFRQLLVESQLAGAIRQRAAHLGRTVESLKIAIKPTFMLGYDRRDLSPLTDVELLHDLAEYLHEQGCHDLVVIEGRNIYDRFFQNRTVQAVADYFGIASDSFRIADTADEQVEHRYHRGMAQYSIARSWRDADFRISFPKFRSHPIEMALLSMGNVEWVGGRCDEYLFLERQADRPTAIMMLLDEFPPHFALVDAFENIPDGLVGVMGCCHPKHLMRFYAGADALAVDTVALRHVGVNEATAGSILRSASHWFGNTPGEIQVIGETSPIQGWQGPYSSELRSMLAMLAYPVYVMGSGRGKLFVPEMDEEAFPSIAPEGCFLKLRRSAVRRLLGLGLPQK